jgi:hypothetical protein
MATKSTVFKAALQVNDLDRHYYALHSLTLAQHPSETDERLMVRILAFALNASVGGALCHDLPAGALLRQQAAVALCAPRRHAVGGALRRPSLSDFSGNPASLSRRISSPRRPARASTGPAARWSRFSTTIDDRPATVSLTNPARMSSSMTSSRFPTR